MGLILDTSALVALERSAGTDRPLALEPSETYALPAIVWAEALVGVRLAPDAQRAAVGWLGWRPSGVSLESRISRR